MLESEWTSRALGRPVIKAFNNIVADSLVHKGLPRGSANRIALPVAGDDSNAKQRVMALIDQIGFDVLDAGPLSDSWRYQPGTPAYCSDPTAQQLPTLLKRANREKAPANRDRAVKMMAKLPADFPPQELVRAARISAGLDSFHVIAPDYPGFGNSDMPDPATYGYTFDKISEVIEAFLKQKSFDRYGLYVQDYGGPVGFRIVGRHPEALEWLIIQNTNAYEVGFTPAWDALRGAMWKNRTPETEKPLSGFLELAGIKSFYLHGAQREELISPDNWNSDFAFMERPNARRVQLDLFYDYRTNVALYPKWQQCLRERQPKTIIFLGTG